MVLLNPTWYGFIFGSLGLHTIALYLFLFLYVFFLLKRNSDTDKFVDVESDCMLIFQVEWLSSDTMNRLFCSIVYWSNFYRDYFCLTGSFCSSHWKVLRFMYLLFLLETDGDNIVPVLLTKLDKNITLRSNLLRFNVLACDGQGS